MELTTLPTCPHCRSAKLQVVKSVLRGEFRIRYYGYCPCKYRPDDN